MLACNHPNSFLDALTVGSYFERPVHFLARGDAFKNPVARKVLTALKVIPIYRLNEGKEYLALNDTTFEKCTEILAEGGIVLIFSEGLCINQWKLRPLKKGTARIALNGWKLTATTKTCRILPVSLNYSSFTRFRKNVIIDFGLPVSKGDISPDKPEGEQIIELNKLIYSRLNKGLLTEENDKSIIQFLLSNFSAFKTNGQKIVEMLKAKRHQLKDNNIEADFESFIGIKKLPVKRTGLFMSVLFGLLLFIPALVGLLVHLPLYIPLNRFIKRKTEGTVFYHSALFGALIITYPVYVLIVSACLALIYMNAIFLSCLLMMPVLAVLFLFWMDCLEGLVNSYKLSKNLRRVLEWE